MTEVDMNRCVQERYLIHSALSRINGTDIINYTLQQMNFYHVFLFGIPHKFHNFCVRMNKANLEINDTKSLKNSQLYMTHCIKCRKLFLKRAMETVFLFIYYIYVICMDVFEYVHRSSLKTK